MVDKKTEGAPTAGAVGDRPASEAGRQAARISIDDRGVPTESCDYWLMNSTPEEVILRLGNTKTNAQGPVKITHRVALSYYCAKRLLGALYQTVQNYEKALGSLDVEPKSGSQRPSV